jgi:hypothetical protein
VRKSSTGYNFLTRQQLFQRELQLELHGTRISYIDAA